MLFRSGGGDMPMRQRADDGDRLLVAGNDGAALEQHPEAGDPVGRPIRKVQQGALLDLAALPVALAQQDGRGRAAIGHRFDVHGDMITTVICLHKPETLRYMGTLEWSLPEGPGDINDLALRKEGTSA